MDELLQRTAKLRSAGTLEDVLANDALATVRVLVTACAEGSNHFPLLDHAFGVVARQIKRVEIATWDGGAFSLDGPALSLNMNCLNDLFAHIDIDINPGDSDEELAALAAEAKIVAFRINLLHELRHVAQGLANYADVTLLKRIAGDEYMSDLDVIADRDAAACYAVIETHRKSGDNAKVYYTAFQHALYLMVRYCFPAFQFKSDRPHKMARAIAISLMAARITRYNETSSGGTSAPRFPVDSAMTVRLTPDYHQYLVVALSPQVAILGIRPMAGAFLIPMLSAIENGQIDQALTSAFMILDDLFEL